MSKFEFANTLLLDMDGVCVNFNKRMFDIYGLAYPDPYPAMMEVEDVLNEVYDLNLPPRHGWKQIAEYGEERFWLELDKYDWFEELISIANKFDSWAFCTRPGRSSVSSGAKHEWINRLLGSTQNDMYLCRGPKSQLANSKTILLDDTPKHVDAFNEAGGIGILFPQPWNGSKDSMESVFERLYNIAEASCP